MLSTWSCNSAIPNKITHKVCQYRTIPHGIVGIFTVWLPSVMYDEFFETMQIIQKVYVNLHKIQTTRTHLNARRHTLHWNSCFLQLSFEKPKWFWSKLEKSPTTGLLTINSYNTASIYYNSSMKFLKLPMLTSEINQENFLTIFYRTSVKRRFTN